MENLGHILGHLGGSTALGGSNQHLRSAYSLNHMEQPPVMRIFDLIFAFAYVGGGDLVDRIEVGSNGGIPWEFQFFVWGCSILLDIENAMITIMMIIIVIIHIYI